MKQEVTNFGKFYRLLRLMPGDQDPVELKERLVWEFTDFRTNSLREMKRTEYERMIEEMERRTGKATETRKRAGYYGPEMDKLRKDTMGVIFAYFRMIREPKDARYVKGIICRAGQVTDMNQISRVHLLRIYNDWRKRVKVREINDEIVKEELVKAGYLEEGDEL